MSSHNSRRKYTPAQKVIIIKKHLLENIPVSKICAEYGINPNLFYKWQKEFFDNGQRAFEKENRATVAKYEKEISEIIRDFCVLCLTVLLLIRRIPNLTP